MIKLRQIAFHHQIGTNRGQEPTARRLVNAKQQPHKGNHIVLHEGLVQQGVQHGGTEHGSCGKGQTEHIGDMRPALLLALQLSERQINQMSTERGRGANALPTFSILLRWRAYLSWARNCMNLMLELCDSSVMLLMLGKNLQRRRMVSKLF